MKMYLRAKTLVIVGIWVLSLGPCALVADDTGLTVQTNFARFLAWFDGEFDNHEQIWQQDIDKVPEDERLEHIHHIFLPVDAPAIGDNTFFVRQYQDGDYEKVYRQRLYNMTYDEATGIARLQIYSFKDEAKYRDTDQDPSIIRDITPEEMKNMPGCDVFWSFQSDHYLGEMKEKACFYFSERMGQNIYITDTLTLTDSEILINDQAFDEQGKRVFGNPIPHKNRKVRYFKGWASIKKQIIDESAPEDEMLFFSGLRIHNEGQILPLVTKEGVDTGYKVQLAQLTYQETKIQILKLGLIDKEGTTFTYIWSNPEAMRIGINLRWMQVGFTDEKL